MQAWVLIFTIGAVQAALLALVLWRRPVNARANRVLAVWLALVAIDLAVKAIYMGAPSPAWFKPYRFVAIFPFLYASLFYIYVRTLTTGHGFSLRDLLHLGGFFFGLLVTGRVFLLGVNTTTALFLRYQHGDMPPPLPWFDLTLFVYAFTYIAAALLRITRHHRLLRQQRSDADRQSMRWLTVLAIGQLIIWMIAAVHATVKLPFIHYNLIYGAVATWILVVSYFSLAQPPVVALPQDDEASGSNASVQNDDSRFPDVEARLSRLMTNEAMYREPALTIGQLARRSGYPEYLVSAVINRRFGGSFWDYVNHHRIEASCECLADPGDTRTILDIAYACGFTSKSTFNAAFKRLLNETPSVYRQRHAQAGHESPASE